MHQPQSQIQEDQPDDDFGVKRKTIEGWVMKTDQFKKDAHELSCNKQKNHLVSGSLTMDDQAEGILQPIDLWKNPDKRGKQNENQMVNIHKEQEINLKKGFAQNKSIFEEDWLFGSAARELNSFLSKQVANLKLRDPLEVLLEWTIEIELSVISLFSEYSTEIYLLWGIGLVCYGGSCPLLAAVFAASEISDMKISFWEGYQIFKILAAEPFAEVTPSEITKSMKEICLQLALLFCVFKYPILAEVCVSVALTSRLSQTFSIRRILRDTLFRSDPDYPELYMSPETNWLLLIGCNVFVFTFLRFAWSLLTAMYMGHLGINCILVYFDRARAKWNFQYFSDIEYVLLNNNSGRSYVWFFLAVMAVWQASFSYSGRFSWMLPFLSALVFTTKLYDFLLEEAMKTGLLKVTPLILQRT